MTRHPPTVLVVLLLVTVAACSGTTGLSASRLASGSSEPLAASATQRSEGGDVITVATWRGPQVGAAFDVALDTHTVDLDPLDLANATLRNDRGDTLTARPWAAPKGGHHREGILTFEGDARAFFTGATWMELVLVGVGNVPERTLRWGLDS